MNKNLEKTLIFVGGCITGAVSTFFISRRYFQKREDKAIESMKNDFKSNVNKIIERTETSETNLKSLGVLEESYDPLKNTSENDKFVAESLINQYKSSTPDVNFDYSETPIIISSEEFGDDPDYDIVTLTYYTDGTLCDDMDYPFEDVSQHVGDDYMTHFGEVDYSSVFVRNDVEKKYYEILFSQKSYDEVKESKPYLKHYQKLYPEMSDDDDQG